MSSPNKHLDKALEVAPIEETSELEPIKSEIVRQPIQNAPAPTEQDFIDDFVYARETLHHVIQQGEEALRGAMRVAKGTEHPRAYEVVSTIIGQISGAAKDLLGLSKIKNDVITKDTNNDEENNEENDKRFVGSTSDLANLIRNLVDEELSEENSEKKIEK